MYHPKATRQVVPDWEMTIRNGGFTMAIGISADELQHQIDLRMAELDEMQEDEEHLGAYGNLLRMTALIAYQRAAELILANNERIERQLAAAGIELSVVGSAKG